MSTHDERIAEFHRLHSSGCFVMPNPWDVGSARALQQLGFPALATTSAGFAWTLGRTDTQATRDEVLEHLRRVVEAVDVPVNADFEGGYAVDPDGVAANVAMAVRVGVVSCWRRACCRRALTSRLSWSASNGWMSPTHTFPTGGRVVLSR